jgi:gliding motility-associated-like protein
MANGQVSLLQQPLPQQYPADGKYTITTTATDAHGCSNKAQRTLTVYPIPATSAGADQWICRGSFYQLKATGAEKYQWQASSSLSCTDCNNPLAAPADSTQYIVRGYNSFGCNRADTVTIRVHQPFTLQVAKGDTICSGTPVRLAASGADQYTWTPALHISNPAAGITTATPQTSTRYTVTAKDNFNCFTDTGSVYIKVWPLPTVALTNVETLPVGQSLQLTPTYSADVTSYQWSNAQTLSCTTCPAPVAKPKTETTYTVLAKNDGGCLAKADVTVHVICSGGNLFIPNTFSPNGDGRNDLFYPKGTGISRIKSMTVYNRWGEVVFSSTNFAANSPEAGWNGTFKGQQLSSDVYVYTCEVVCLNNEVLTYKGDIALLR